MAFGYFSTLLISVVSKNDEGNIICIGQERNITINLGGGFRKDYISFSSVTEIQVTVKDASKLEPDN